jgi:uncharacterized protein with HEPN domain
MPRRDEAYALDMLIAAQTAMRFIDGKSREQFLQDELLQSGLIRQIQVIGEAAWKSSATFRDANPQVAWAKIIGMRHRLVHDYLNVDLELVWAVATQHAPELVESLARILPGDGE